jgi:hypothetical protein
MLPSLRSACTTLLCLAALGCGGAKDPASAAAAGDIPALKELLKSSDAGVRAATLTEVGKIAASNADAQALLVKDALGSPNEDVWKGALPLLLERAVAGDAWAVKAYQDALASSRQEVQVEAVKALQKKGGAALKSFSSEFAELLADPDEPVVTATTEALKALGEDGWPIVKAALESPRPSLRAKGVAAAAALDATKNHLDDIAARLPAEDDEAVKPKLEEILVKAEGKAFAPILKLAQGEADFKKRVRYYDLIENGVIVYEDKAAMEKDPKKKPVYAWRCEDILKEVDGILALSEKSDLTLKDPAKEYQRPSYWISTCITGKDKRDKPEAKATTEKLRALVRTPAEPGPKRRFALFTLCYFDGAAGTDKDTKAYLKTAPKTETDPKMKDILKKEGC